MGLCDDDVGLGTGLAAPDGAGDVQEESRVTGVMRDFH